MNTNVELYQALRRVVIDGDSQSTLPYDQTDRRVAKLFLDDFEQCGIHLDEEKRKYFVDLTEGIMSLESSFQLGTQAPSVISPSVLPSHLRNVFGSGDKPITVSSMYSEDMNENVREAAYMAYLYPNEYQSNILDMLLTVRGRLSQLVGFNSFAERALLNTMTETPVNAQRFLLSLNDGLSDLARQDFCKLQLIKQNIGGSSAELKPWDVGFCSALARKHGMSLDISEVSAYLSLGSCIEGLSILVQNLYGVRLVDVNPQPQEIWHKSIYKLEVRAMDGDSLVGTIYCDFFERHDKPHQDCHFTIRGGRLQDNGQYQAPKVVLMMNFPSPTNWKPSLLTPSQLDNLFHEFGHAMHSMLGRTRYQHVTGTRCSTDFAEVPSILMEYFANDYRVLRKFAKHYQTGEVIPEAMAEKMTQSRSLFVASETQLQVFYSALDQALHNEYPLQTSTIFTLARIQNQFYGLPYVPNTAWHLRFGHLVGYGAKYFAYLMSRAIAARIWQTCFKEDPLSREMGERYVQEVLSHGGQKEPYEMIEALTGTKPSIDSLTESLITETRIVGQYT